MKVKSQSYNPSHHFYQKILYFHATSHYVLSSLTESSTITKDERGRLLRCVGDGVCWCGMNDVEDLYKLRPDPYLRIRHTKIPKRNKPPLLYRRIYKLLALITGSVLYATNAGLPHMKAGFTIPLHRIHSYLVRRKRLKA